MLTTVSITPGQIDVKSTSPSGNPYPPRKPTTESNTKTSNTDDHSKKPDSDVVSPETSAETIDGECCITLESVTPGFGPYAGGTTITVILGCPPSGCGVVTLNFGNNTCSKRKLIKK